MLVSLLTLTCGYHNASIILGGLSVAAFVAEFVWIHVVYGLFPILRTDEGRRRKQRLRNVIEEEPNDLLSPKKGLWSDWVEFASMPIIYCTSATSISRCLEDDIGLYSGDSPGSHLSDDTGLRSVPHLVKLLNIALLMLGAPDRRDQHVLV